MTIDHLFYTSNHPIMSQLSSDQRHNCFVDSMAIVSPMVKIKEEEKKIQIVIVEINLHIAVFRDLLIHVGSNKDAPALREKIRRVRRQCVEACKSANSQLLPKIKSALYEGTILDNQQLVCLYMLTQLLERELDKCHRLVVAMPIDMTRYYEENRTATHSLGNVLSQIVLCNPMKPDFNAEEKVSIENDLRDVRHLIVDMAECLPKEDPEKAHNGLTNNEEGRKKFYQRRWHGSHGTTASGIIDDMSCCLGNPHKYS